MDFSQTWYPGTREDLLPNERRPIKKTPTVTKKEKKDHPENQSRKRRARTPKKGKTSATANKEGKDTGRLTLRRPGGPKKLGPFLREREAGKTILLTA